MGIFRSEKMLLCQILFSQETVFDCIEMLGNIGLVEFRDLNVDTTQYQRTYVADIRRCQEMERKLRIIEEEIKKFNIHPKECSEVPSAPKSKETLTLETNLESLVNDVQNVSDSSEALRRNLLEVVEQHYVIRKAGGWLQTNQPFFDEEKQEDDGKWENRREKGMGHLKITTGVIPVEKVNAFEVLIWRICRGVAFVKIIHVAEALTDIDTGAQVKKAVFIVVCQGNAFNDKILKICQAFHCNLYPCPGAEDRRAKLETEAITSLTDIKQVLQQSLDHQKRVLSAAGKNLEKWKYQVLKLKSIYHVMNMFQLDECNEFTSAECWMPKDDFNLIREKLSNTAAQESSQNDPILIMMNHSEEPPTFNRTNKFTSAFQSLIDAYGVSSYREMNPMPFTIITFPFLFAVMFGDFGHGFLLTIFSTFMILSEKKLLRKKPTGEIQRVFFEGRYIILLMGIFSCYTGFIYNDIFSKSVNIFGSCWYVNYTESEIEGQKSLQLDPVLHYRKSPYYVGMDPIWQSAENKIMFQNSFKMKISIIFGVSQMLFGVFLSSGNHMNSGDRASIVTEMVPQVLFLCCLFVYLVSLIFAKWVLYGPLSEKEESGIHCAPNILITFINMILFKKEKVKPPCKSYIYENQDVIQTCLVVVALICVPWMLVFKTVSLLKKRGHPKDQDEESVDIKKEMMKMAQEEEEEEDAAEIVIHQGIKTIEFVLGSVSHTASYLRLWALSLAHAQLSDVLWNMVLRIGISSRSITGGILLSLTFAAWAVLTISILAMMEGLSAFLHTLRLHWVEFQSKFYSGNGYPFRPFSFQKIFDQEEVEETQ